MQKTSATKKKWHSLRTPTGARIKKPSVSQRESKLANDSHRSSPLATSHARSSLESANPWLPREESATRSAQLNSQNCTRTARLQHTLSATSTSTEQHRGPQSPFEVNFSNLKSIL